MNTKPRILLIPNVAWWVIGEMGKQIIARFGNKYDFYFLPEGVLERRPDLLRSLVPAVDAIHCLNESSIDLFRDFDPRALPPIATWIHHVTTWSPQHQMAIDRSSALTVCTPGWKDYLDTRTLARIPVTIVPHGVDTEFFRQKKVHRKRFGIPAGRFVLGFVGSKGSDFDSGRKGTDIFLEVVRNAAARLPNLHVVIGGPGWEKEAAELKALNISVYPTGYIRKSDLPSLYSALDVYLLTSRVEGGPCTVFEAMACETAVVSTRVGAVTELITDGENGFSADVDDAGGLLAAVIHLAQSPEMKIALAKAGRATVEMRTWAQTLSPLEGMYDKLIQRRISSPMSGPSWMIEPGRLVGASCAADALLTVYTRIQRRSMRISNGIRTLREMLSNQSPTNIWRGATMIQKRTRIESKP